MNNNPPHKIPTVISKGLKIFKKETPKFFNATNSKFSEREAKFNTVAIKIDIGVAKGILTIPM